MYQPAPATNGLQPSIKIDDTVLKKVDNFTYLGSGISSFSQMQALTEKSCSVCLNQAAHLESCGQEFCKSRASPRNYGCEDLRHLKKTGSVSSPLASQEPGRQVGGQSNEPCNLLVSKQRSLKHSYDDRPVWTTAR